jgi:hypothetical protein
MLSEFYDSRIVMPLRCERIILILNYLRDDRGVRGAAGNRDGDKSQTALGVPHVTLWCNCDSVVLLFGFGT